MHGGSILCPHAILALCNLVPSCNFDQFIYEIDIKTVKHQILFYNKYKLNNFDNKSIVVLYTNLSNKAVYEYSCSLTLFMKQVFFYNFPVSLLYFMDFPIYIFEILVEPVAKKKVYKIRSNCKKTRWTPPLLPYWHIMFTVLQCLAFKLNNFKRIFFK